MFFSDDIVIREFFLLNQLSKNHTPKYRSGLSSLLHEDINRPLVFVPWSQSSPALNR